MAHYDCRDCGEYMGIAYGRCDNCTPPEVKAAERKWEHTYQYFYEEYMDGVREKAKEYAIGRSLKDKQKYLKLFEDNHPNKKEVL